MVFLDWEPLQGDTMSVLCVTKIGYVFDKDPADKESTELQQAIPSAVTATRTTSTV